jgi:redox-sensitive bicupin YhaK (pirin superfamily)
VWHGKELSAGRSATVQGLQLWIALPPELEDGPPQSRFVEADAMRTAGPAHVILGRHEGVSSPIEAPEGINYLLVRLQPGEGAIAVPAHEDEGAAFVLDSAVPHPHRLHLGYHSVHTSPTALAAGERRVEELGLKLREAGDRSSASGATPVFR